MDRRTYLFVVAGAGGCLTGCLGPTNPTGSRKVEMTDVLTFDPRSLSVRVGTTVEWVNEGRIEHTVTAREKSLPDGAEYFASGGFATEKAARTNLAAGLLGPDETFQHTFEVPGTYEYYCIPHEGSGMIGSIRVRS